MLLVMPCKMGCEKLKLTKKLHSEYEYTCKDCGWITLVPRPKAIRNPKKELNEK